jgi:membrane protease YdiL (CAAX protease family)
MTLIDSPRFNRLSGIVLAYYVLASVFALLLGIVQPATGIPVVIIQLTQFGPMLAVLVVLWLLPGSRGLVRQAGLQSSKAGIAQLGEAVLIVVAIFVVALAWYGLSGHMIDFTNPFDMAHPIWLILIAQFIGAAGEEIGWRCFLQPALQTRMGVLLSSVVVGLLWGVWHVGVFAEGWLYASSFILFAVCLSVILGELLRGKRLKLPTATTFHALINLAMLLWFKEEGGDAYAMATMAVATLIAAVCALIVHSVRTGRGTRKSNNTFPELR